MWPSGQGWCGQAGWAWLVAGNRGKDVGSDGCLSGRRMHMSDAISELKQRSRIIRTSLELSAGLLRVEELDEVESPDSPMLCADPSSRSARKDGSPSLMRSTRSASAPTLLPATKSRPSSSPSTHRRDGARTDALSPPRAARRMDESASSRSRAVGQNSAFWERLSAPYVLHSLYVCQHAHVCFHISIACAYAQAKCNA